MVEILDGEKWFAKLSQVQLQNASHRVDVRSIGDVGQGVLAAFETVSKIVDFNLGSRLSKDSVVMEAVAIDDAHAALDDRRNVHVGVFQVLFQTPAEQLGCAVPRGLANSTPASGIWSSCQSQHSLGSLSRLVPKRRSNVVVFSLKSGNSVRV